jgi:outer membrane receptor protein involved in Fe transport
MRFKHYFFLALSLFSFSTFLYSAPDPSGSLGGTLLDKETKSPLEFVNVLIFKGESASPVKVASTNDKGIFQFSNITPGNYRLEARFIGYLPYKQNISIQANQEAQLGEIRMNADTKVLRSVEVTGIRSNMKLEIDKKVFSVDQTIASAGASASDILKNIPSVEVDAEGSISLRNSSNVTIWINGKPSGLTADNRAQVLEQMPAESIDRVEVITNPSAKFSSEGSAGIINIILKKDRKAGYYGSIRAGASLPWGYNFGGNINYNNSKFDLYANIGFRDDSNTGSGYTNRETYTTDALTELTTNYMNSLTDRDSEHHGLFLRGGVDYHINDKHTIGLSGFSMNGGRQSNSDITYDYLDTNLELTSKRQRTSTSDGDQKNSELTLDYQWDIGKEHNLHTILSFGTRNSPSESDYEQTDYNPSGSVTGNSYQKQTDSGSEDELEFQTDYTRKISENWRLEAGWKSSLSNRTSENQIYNGTASGSGWTLPTNPDIENQFDYDEQIHAAYATLTGKITSKLGYQLGLRAEQTCIAFTSTDVLSGESSSNDKNYLKLFPTIFLNYGLSEGNDIQLNYSKRINRPRGRSLNPFVNISDSSNIWIGNPDLNPEYSHSFELNYLKTWERHTLSTSLYHRINQQVIQDIRYLDNGVMYQSPSNVTNSTSSGMEFVVKDAFTKILETTTTLSLFRESMDGFTYRNKTYDGTSGFSWNARLNGTLLLSKGLSGQVSGYYSAPRVIAQGEMKAAYSLDLGLRKNFLNRKLQLSINAQNLLNSFKLESTTRGDGFYQETSSQFMGRSLRMNLTWNFGNQKPKEKSDKSHDQEGSSETESEL